MLITTADCIDDPAGQVTDCYNTTAGCEIQVMDLQPSCLYTFKIMAQNNIGMSISAPAEFVTKGRF